MGYWLAQILLRWKHRSKRNTGDLFGSLSFRLHFVSQSPSFKMLIGKVTLWSITQPFRDFSASRPTSVWYTDLLSLVDNIIKYITRSSNMRRLWYVRLKYNSWNLTKQYGTEYHFLECILGTRQVLGDEKNPLHPIWVNQLLITLHCDDKRPLPA